jgi:glycosyltransferase involved in cell wall biosynthesis
VSVTAGAFIVGAPAAFERALADRPVALAAPVVVVPSDTTVPHLTLRDPDAPLSTLLVAVAPGSEAMLTAWQRTMAESLFDPHQTSPSDLRPALLSTLLGSEAVATEGTASVMRWSDYAAVIADGGWDGRCFAVDTAELWDLATATTDRVGGEMTEAEYRLVDLRVHDASPLDPLISAMHEAVDAAGPQDEVTPFEALTREIRRCTDPLGTLWPPGERDRFEAWLFERNERGSTRIADLFWYASENLRSQFPHARTNPADYVAWCRSDGRRILGFDLLDRAITPVIPDSADTVDAPGGWKHAVKWRWNVVRGLVPGLAAAEERRLLGLDVVSGPEAGGGTEPPRHLEVARAPAPWGSAPRSLSLIGCLRAESGLGQASRASLRALRSLELPFTYIDTSEMYPSRNAVDPGLDRSAFGAIGDVNLIHANAMEIVKMNGSVFRHRLGGRFSAAMWFWEAGNLPAWKLAAFDRIDELWVASSYLADVLGQYGRVPVHSVGLAAPLPAERIVDRRSLGVPDDDFVFLFVYDALSSHGRKNPELALRAYIDAFGPEFDGVRLVVKASNLNKLPVDRDRLMELASRTDSITVIDRYLDHEAVYDLMAAADVYVSLHAAEGYGLTILEAMSLGTPCICTGYSGNMDFTSSENSWLVDYTLARTREIAGPYPKGSVWAVPDSEHAAVLMRRVASHPEEVAAKGVAARTAAIEAASLDRYAGELGRRLAAVM